MRARGFENLGHETDAAPPSQPSPSRGEGSGGGEMGARGTKLL
jgi:hypothetical protein